MKEQKWISVKDRLPENSGEVIFFDSSAKDVSIAYFDSISSLFEWESMYTKASKNDYWMPFILPPAPNSNS